MLETIYPLNFRGAASEGALGLRWPLFSPRAPLGAGGQGGPHDSWRDGETSLGDGAGSGERHQRPKPFTRFQSFIQLERLEGGC